MSLEDLLREAWSMARRARDIATDEETAAHCDRALVELEHALQKVAP